MLLHSKPWILLACMHVACFAHYKCAVNDRKGVVPPVFVCIVHNSMKVSSEKQATAALAMV